MKYVFKKVLSCIITLFIVSLLVFVAFSLIPGDPALSRLGTNATEQALASLRHQMGLDRPLVVRYFEWLAGALRGDFGKSYSYSMTVTSMIADKLPITLTLMLYSMVLMVIISIPLGVYAS